MNSNQKLTIKNQKLILLLLLCSAPLFAQQSKHEFSVIGAGGLSTLVYSTDQSHRTPGAGATLGLGYEYYFTERWSLGTGLEFSWLNAKNRTYSITDHYGATDNEKENFDFRYTFTGYREKQHVNMLSVPVMGYFHTGKNYPLYAGVGGKIGLPVHATYSGSSESLVTKGYYPVHNALVENPASRGFGTYNDVQGSGNLKLKPAFMLSAEAGTVFSLGKEKKYKLYAGFYADYGITNQHKSNKSPVEYHAATPDVDYSHHSMLASADGQGRAYTGRVAPLFAGVRLRFTFGKSKKTVPCTYTGQDLPERVRDSLVFVHDTVFVRDTVYKTDIVRVSGIIRDGQTGKPVPATVEVIDNVSQKEIARVPGNPVDGSYSIGLSRGTDYGFMVWAHGYMPQSENLDLTKPDVPDPLAQNIDIQKVTTGAKITLKNINFDFGTANFTPSSTPELQHLVRWLSENPSIHIEISGHTDSMGPDAVNQALSVNRAKTVNDYLVKHGIDAQRLRYTGYGSTQPVATNDTAEGRAKNRRTDIKVE